MLQPDVVSRRRRNPVIVRLYQTPVDPFASFDLVRAGVVRVLKTSVSGVSG